MKYQVKKFQMNTNFEYFHFISIAYKFILIATVPWSPYWEHIKEAWEKRDGENLLFLFYEDLVNVIFIIFLDVLINNYIFRTCHLASEKFLNS
jgi:Sulfotransferase domain